MSGQGFDTDFLDENAGRYFPFVDNDGNAVPNWLMVDFRAEIRQGGFDVSTHRIYLAWITRLGPRIRMGFRTDCPELADQELVFERNVGDSKWRTEHVSSTPLAETIEERCGCSDELLCNSGFEDKETCGELLCNPNLDAGCSPEQVCNPDLA